MITAYYRPKTIEEALTLLRKPNTRPLGGGTILTRRSDEQFEVVDLQALEMDKFLKSGNNLIIGATVSLQSLLEFSPSPSSLKTAIKLDVTVNQRTYGTVAGALVTCDGRSPFASVTLALNTRITVNTGKPEVYELGDFLTFRFGLLKNQLIENIEIPLDVLFSFEYIARSPADRPIVISAVAQWVTGRTRVVVAGWGESPKLAFDGTNLSGIESGIFNQAKNSTNELASSEYRVEMLKILTKRCLDKLSNINTNIIDHLS
jgi:CO/xanthine dehydrogenase FAD-binding subunit